MGISHALALDHAPDQRTPEASWILAGGANHRFRQRNAASPGRGDGMIVARFPQPRPGLGLNPHDEPVVCSRRGDLMSNVPSGQVAAFPALTLDMQCVLVGLRSKNFAKHIATCFVTH